jgi:hypothetical protein
MSTEHQPPIDRIVLRDERIGSDTRHLEAAIDAGGDLVLTGQDLGPEVRKILGSDEYEYSHTIDATYKDTMLLRLLKDKFDEGMLFDDWLKEHGIPHEFHNWYSPD